MKEQIKDLWTAEILCITTNGFVKSNGECVMGRGCAYEAKLRYPKLPLKLGRYITRYGNRVLDLGVQSDGKRIISFPVKPRTAVFNGSNAVKHMRQRFRIGDTVPGWATKADLKIIEQSCKQLVVLADRLKLTDVHLPRPGCGAGELNYEVVKPVLEKYLDDRFIIVSKERRKR